MRVEPEIQSNQALGNHGQGQRRAPQMKGRFREDRLAGEQWLGHALRETDRPCVVRIRPVGERHEKTSIGDALRDLEKSFLDERFRGPRTDPARRMNGSVSPFALAFSSCSRTIFPWGTPVLAAVCSSHRASSGSRRTVIVLLICHLCKAGCGAV
jgi:hypothetical protein